MSMQELRTYESFKLFVDEVKELKQQYVERNKDARNLRQFGVCQGAVEAIDAVLEICNRTPEEENDE